MNGRSHCARRRDVFPTEPQAMATRTHRSAQCIRYRQIHWRVHTTHDGGDDEGQQAQPVVGIGLRHAGSNLVHLEPTHRPDGEDVEARREDDREDESRATTRAGEY